MFSLEKSLNDHFDIAQRRIYLTDGYRYERFYIYTHAEHRPVYLGTKYLHPSSDYADTGVDFIVWIPGIFVGQSVSHSISMSIDTKKPSKRFKIGHYFGKLISIQTGWVSPLETRIHWDHIGKSSLLELVSIGPWGRFGKAIIAHWLERIALFKTGQPIGNSGTGLGNYWFAPVETFDLARFSGWEGF